MTSFQINKRPIGQPFHPYIIAEIGVNHEGSLDLARRLIDEAAEGGAHAAKFQSYKAETLASRHSPAYWDTNLESTTSQFQLFKKYDRFGPAEYEALARHCESAGVDFLSTPFDLVAVDFLDPLVPAFKIASADITNLPLLRKVAGRNKPVLISTGASSLPEIEFAVQQLREHGAAHICLLHCVLNYPTPAERAHLAVIEQLRRVFPDCPVGYSDHVVPDAVLTPLKCAVMLGAVVLEKHFTHDKTLPGNDHYHAMDRHDLRRFRERLQLIQNLLGSASQKDLAGEAAARLHARRSIVAARPIAAGELLTEDNLTTKRPAHGISPLHWDEVVGSRAAVAIAEDDLLRWPMVQSGSN